LAAEKPKNVQKLKKGKSEKEKGKKTL